jgi:hypothetical protein
MEVAMIFETESASGECYPVEISGWNSSEKFFVEETVLHWCSDGTREVRFQSVMRQGSIVFVRLLLPVFDPENFPIAYRTDCAESENADGEMLARLTRLHPQPSCKKEAPDSWSPGSMAAGIEFRREYPLARVRCEDPRFHSEITVPLWN